MIGRLSQIQSTSNAAVSRGRLSCSQTEQSLKSGHGLVTPIVAKNKFIEVNLKLRTADTVVGTDQPLLEIAERPVSQRDDRFGALAQLSCLGLYTRDMPIASFVQTRETLQRVGVEGRAWSDMLLDKATERGCLKVWDPSHSQPSRHLAAFLNGHQTRAARRPFS